MLEGPRMVHRMEGKLEELGSEGVRTRTAPEILAGAPNYGHCHGGDESTSLRCVSTGLQALRSREGKSDWPRTCVLVMNSLAG